MTEGSSSAVACLIVTTSGRILLLWDQDDSLPFRYPQLAMLLASLFHFAQAQPFGHLELHNGFTLIVSSDVAAQVSVAVILATPTAISQRQWRVFRRSSTGAAWAIEELGHLTGVRTALSR